MLTPYEQHITPEKNSYLDLKIINFGIQQCNCSHAFGPAVRTNYLLHYIFSGTGKFEYNKCIYTLLPGQAFLIYPKIITYYKADAINPWYYAWIEFDGAFAKEYIKKIGFSQENPIFTPRSESSETAVILHSLFDLPYNFIRVTGIAHLFFDMLIQNSIHKADEVSLKNEYIEQVLNYIHVNYWRKIKVAELSSLCGLERSYFSRLFKAYTGQSPQEYIISLKCERAKELLRHADLSIGDVGRSVGYTDQLAFSKIFKKVTGKPPNHFR